MNKTVDITPIELRDYAISLGWKLIPEALRDGLFVLNSPNNDYKQLSFSKDFDNSNSDIVEQIQIVISKLAKTLNKSEFKVLEEIREVNDDVISLRYFSDQKIVNSLSFQETFDAIEGTKQMLLSAASSIVNPATFHPRLSRTEPNDLLRKTRFRHTQEGSFILKISCPIELDAIASPGLFGEEFSEPYARKTFALINRSSVELLNAIESNTEQAFVELQKGTNQPIISYNFCSALTQLYDEERELPFELKFDWSRNSLTKIRKPEISNVVRYPYSFKNKIEEVKNYFKPENSEVTDTFIATVESLNGNLGDNARRSGEIRLSVLIESTIVNARAMLNADQYKEADKAHMNAGSYVKIKGKLQPGRQIKSLTDISEFTVIER